MKEVVIAVYLDNDERLIKEFEWLYKSWILSGSWQNSDLALFHHPKISPQYSETINIPIQPITELNPVWGDYGFINSVWFLTTPEAAFLTGYKYLLRTDHDTFLTPNFPKLRPRLATFGIGMYSQVPEVINRLVQVAENWNILFNFNNVGSTFMARSDLALQYCQLHFEFCKKLKQDEFSDGPGKWPGWFEGVLTMYAGNLAANAFFGTGLTLGGLDCHCMSQDEMCNTDYHIHAWHTWDYFSKFAWQRGDYREIPTASLNPKRISDYCLWIAGPGP